MSRPNNQLLTRRLEGSLNLRPLLPGGNHFFPGEQTLHLDVVKAIGRRRDADHCGCRSGINVEDHHRPGTPGDGAVHGDKLAAGSGQHFLDRFAAIGIRAFWPWLRAPLACN
jgi:hypothetical protein